MAISGNEAPLHLAAHGLSRKDMDVLRSLLSLYGPRLNRECRLCGVSDRADVHLIDIDDPVGWASWQMLRDRDQCIVLSNDAAEAPRMLNKPLRAPALLAILSEYIFHAAQPGDTARHLRPVLAGEALVATEPRQVKGRLLIDLLETGAIDTCVRIAVSDVADGLWIDPELRQYLLGSTLTQLRDFLRTPLQPAQVSAVSREDFIAHARRVRPRTLTRLQWFSALACSNGRLTQSLEPTAPMQLTSWPDMEGHSPRFFRLAGLLVKQAVDFNTILAMTGIDAVTTADFLNACHRCGIVRQAVVREKAGSKFTFSGRGIVARLRERLGL